MKSTRIMVVVAIAAAAVLLLSGVALAQTFPDVDASNVHSDAIEWAAENGIVQGYENGNFGPFDNITRGQAASMFMRYEDYRMEDVDARRGCEDCHAGPYSLANEVPDGHAAMPADADINTCLFCHRIDPDGTGNIANISLRDIVHPVHMGSKTFAWEFMGNCFSCHNVDANGQFDVLAGAVDTDPSGIPDEIPIPQQQDPVTPVG